ncbi:hypothetical protein F4777DRAFT_539336 [Nemania sp. FL0916]|nr:hypothetical protein F4777DRAFT_539336 [Nemania sp. FL0916]
MSWPTMSSWPTTSWRKPEMPPDADEDKYHALCEDYFKKTYKRRLQSWSTEPLHSLFESPAQKPEVYPLPDYLDDGILPYLLNDMPFFFFCTAAERDKIDPELPAWLLWEMYGASPGRFFQLYLSLLSSAEPATGYGVRGRISADAHFPSIICDIIDYKECNSMEEFYQSLGTSATSENHEYRWQAAQIQGRMKLLRDDLIESQLDFCWTASMDCRSRLYYPLYYGLVCYIRSIYDKYSIRLLEDCLDRMPDLTHCFTPAYEGDSELPYDFSKGPNCLFNAAGTGKTRLILNKLCKRWGLYFISPSVKPAVNIRISTAENTDTTPTPAGEEPIMEPTRSGASRDTYSEYEARKIWERSGLLAGNWMQLESRSEFWHRLQVVDLKYGSHMDFGSVLVQSRVALFVKYKEMKNATKLLWTALQISCSPRNDPFDVFYRLFRLASLDIDTRTYTWGERPGSALLQDVFIDESQDVLGNLTAEAIQYWLSVTALLSFSPNLLYSGTSLKLDDTIQHLRTLWPSHGLEIFCLGKYVKNKADFWKALRDHIRAVTAETYAIKKRQIQDCDSAAYPLFCRGGKPLRFDINFPEGRGWPEIDQALAKWDLFQDADHSSIEKVCTRFFGRIRWTTLFAEELLRSSSIKQGSLNDEDVENAANITKRRIKKALKHQIERIKNQSWVDDLFWMAINADLFSVAKVLPNRKTAELIAQGFALVDTSANNPTSTLSTYDTTAIRGCLSEPLAVEAIMEYLRESGESGDYDRLIYRFLSSLDMDYPDASFIGKPCEFIFTMTLDKLLRPPNPLTSDDNSLSAYHGERFLDRLAQAINCGQTGVKRALSDTNIDLHQYELDDNHTTLYQVQELDNSFRFLKDLISDDNEAKRSTFLFPSIMDGPDLMFYLRRSSKIDNPQMPLKILCSVQFKTGTAHLSSCKELTEVLQTLVIKPWQNDETGSNHGAHTWPVIHILVTSGVDIHENRFLEALEKIAGVPSNIAIDPMAMDIDIDTKPDTTRGLRETDFVCYIDKADSENIWGVALTALLHVLKPTNKKRRRAGERGEKRGKKRQSERDCERKRKRGRVRESDKMHDSDTEDSRTKMEM